MKQRITEFLNRWSPWRLRREIDELNSLYAKLFNDFEALRFQRNSFKADYNECKRLLDQKEDMISEAQQFVIDEKERLEKENEKLRYVLGSAVRNALTLKSRVIDFIDYCTDQAKGGTE